MPISAPTSDVMKYMPAFIGHIGSSLYKRRTPLDSVSLNVSPIKAAKGTVIDSLFIQEMTVTDVVPSETQPNYQQPEVINERVTLDNWKNVKFKYDVDTMDRPILEGTFMDRSIFTATITMMDYITGGISNALRLTPNLLIKTSTPITSYSDVVSLNRLITSDAPSAFRAVFFGRDSEAALFNETKIMGVGVNNSSSSSQSGEFTEILGYQMIPYEDNNSIVTKTKNYISGDIAFTLPANLNAYQEYEVVATVASANDTKSFHPGNVLIDQSQADKDKTSCLTVHKVSVVSSTTATITISVGAEFHSFTGGSVTCKMLNVMDDAFAYQKFGIGLASRPSSNVGLTRKSMHFDDQINQLAYGLTTFDGYYTNLLSLDFLYGVKILLHKHVARAVKISSDNSGYVA